MWEQAVSSWPLIPYSIAVVLLFVTGAVCVIALWYDAGARDTGRVTQFGVLVLGIGILGCMGIGLWNVTVSIAMLSTHNTAFAASAPSRLPQE
jgi:hypothetical protein